MTRANSVAVACWRLALLASQICQSEPGGWDYHDNIYGRMPANAKALDSGLSSLLSHLGQKGLLDSTLVVVSTEFGRKPDVNPNAGRDHHPDGFTCLMAGAGVKAGQIYGTTTSDGKHAEKCQMSRFQRIHSMAAWD